jgi:hypothetical protein
LERDLLAVALVLLAGLVVPFVAGFWHGPRPGTDAGRAQAALHAPEQTMWPLGRIARLYTRFLVLYVIVGALYGHGLPWTGYSGEACVSTAYSGPSRAGTRGLSARPDGVLRSVVTVQVCARHPSLRQWGLFLLTRVAGPALWACVLLLIWQLIRRAAADGPFTPQAAATMRRLGWVVIAGSMIAGAVTALGNDVLTYMLMTSPPYNGPAIAVDVLIAEPLRALLPVPALAGAALLSFARIVRAGAVLDEEIRATV